VDTLAAFLHDAPALCLFLSILLGTLIGRVHVKGVGFGNVVGTLLAGMIIGIVARPELPDLMRWIFFYLFLFSVGYAVGPQFFGSLRREAVPQVVLSLVVAVTGLATVIVVVAIFGFDEGLAVGILSGGMTQSAALGTGIGAIAQLPIAPEMRTALAARAPLGDAITYGFGDLGLILFLTWLGPKMLGADLKREARALEAQLAGGRPRQVFSGVHLAVRAHLVQNPDLAGVTVEALERRYADTRLTVQRVQRDGALVPLGPRLALQPGDQIVVAARRNALLTAEAEIGPELSDPDLLSIPVATAAVVVTNRAVIGQALGDLGQSSQARGVYLVSLRRGSELMPREAWTTVERGDILTVTGAPEDVERAARHVGFVERDLAKTDLTILAAGIGAGMLLGLLSVSVGGIPVGLGTAGSILVVGLVAGWARSRYPVFGAIPEPAQRLLMDIGLIVFIAVVGLQAGPHAVEAYHVSGGAFFVSILVAGMIVTVMPLAVGTIVARYVLRMSPLMILGGLAGAQTCTPGLSALREASGSHVASIAYTVPYAINNILLTVWGAVVVAIVHAMRGPSP
jgi:putative transport protein